MTASAAHSWARQAASGRRPFLDAMVTSILAPTVALSDRDGQIRPGNGAGVYVNDRRIISASVVTFDGDEPDAITQRSVGAEAQFLGVIQSLGDPGPDGTVFLERVRELTRQGAVERITVRNLSQAAVRTRVALTLAADHQSMAGVRAGRTATTLPAALVGADLQWAGTDGAVTTAAPFPPPDRTDPDIGVFEWLVELDRTATETVEVAVTVRDPHPPVVTARQGESVLGTPVVEAGDPRLAALLDRSIADLKALELSDPLAPDDHFLAAGAPWYLTLFGRDSLWAARMLLPLGPALAAGTLRTLARRQGTRVNASRAEEPGKILHEIRDQATDHGARHGPAGRSELQLPALYYGTIDATPLWISLLHDAWRWGMPPDEVEHLIPTLEAALGWLAQGVEDGGGFLRYTDLTGHGLANQGWKDSFDAVHYSDGLLAEPPIALVEVQGYAHAAARHAATLLDAFDRPGGGRWRAWADALAGRFRQHFWVDDSAGPYPAIALDAASRPVDILTSNIGHLFGSGLLDAQEADRVVDRLMSTSLNSGFGVRTLSSSARRYNPQSYHCGSVWTHDTAITIAGLARVGTAKSARAAGQLICGVLTAAESFDFQLPELFGGEPAGPGMGPAPYRASCRPQAWSAASAVVIVTALLGLYPDLPAGTVDLTPLPAATSNGDLRVCGLHLGGVEIRVEVSAAAKRPSISGCPPSIRVRATS